MAEEIGITFSVTYNGNGATSGSAPQTVQYPLGSPVTVAGQGDLERAGCTFAGWNDGGVIIRSPGYTYPEVYFSFELTAVWTVSVTYIANEITSGSPPAPAEYPVGSSVIIAGDGNLVKSGYTFGGWNDGTATRGAGYSYSNVSQNLTLTAVWTENSPAGGGGENAVCFLGNAPVLTPTGYRRIDSLVAGDMVRTADGRDVEIQRVKHQRILAPLSSVNPYVIPKGQFGATENLAISPRHCVAVPGRGMVEARELGLRQLSMRAAFDYFNLELPEWDNMVVAGVEVESLAPKKRVVMTTAEFRQLVSGTFGRSVDLAKLSEVARILSDGRIEVALTRKARRM
jgi:hypothetical protein